jgi:ribonucleoside-diphosphate reductase alpha chain
MTKKLLDYFAGDELAASTWLGKYALCDKNGEPIEETPEDMHHRLAREFWRVEKNFIDQAILDRSKLSEYGQKREDLSEEKIYELFDKFRYIVPAGSVMAGAGSGKPVSLSNCFVLPTMPKDSYSSIMFSRLEMVQLEKRRGGTGVDLSNLRPRGAFVNNAAKTSTGAASFMEGFSAINNEVAQQGRRGALMITISIAHPDSPEFVEIKQDLTKVTGANVSVKIPNDFMKAVEKNEDYLLHWPVQGDHVPIKEVEMEYNILYPSQYVTPDGKTGRGYIKKIRAKELWDTLIHCAWNTAEPGILFETTLHEYAPDHAPGCSDNNLYPRIAYEYIQPPHQYPHPSIDCLFHKVQSAPSVQQTVRLLGMKKTHP